MDRQAEELERIWFGKGAAAWVTPLDSDLPFYRGLLSKAFAELETTVRQVVGEWVKWFQEEVEKRGYTYVAGSWGYEMPDKNQPHGAIWARFGVAIGDKDPARALTAVEVLTGRSRNWKVLVMGRQIEAKYHAVLTLP